MEKGYGGDGVWVHSVAVGVKVCICCDPNTEFLLIATECSFSIWVFVHEHSSFTGQLG